MSVKLTIKIGVILDSVLEPQDQFCKLTIQICLEESQYKSKQNLVYMDGNNTERPSEKLILK